MKQTLFALFTLALICCSRNQNDPTVIGANELQGHYWICDSVRTTIAGIGNTVIVGQGMGLEIEYDNNGTYTVYSNPELWLMNVNG